MTKMINLQVKKLLTAAIIINNNVNRITQQVFANQQQPLCCWFRRTLEQLALESIGFKRQWIALVDAACLRLLLWDVAALHP